MDLIEERSPQEKLIIAKTLIESVLDELPSAQPETCAYWDRESNICALHRPSAQQNLQLTCNQLATDSISRQAAIDEIDEWIKAFRENGHKESAADACLIQDGIIQLPSAQPERLTDDDFETIRIHLNAYKENLCNQRRWKEAEEYQQLIDRFMSFASVQPEIIRCENCKHFHYDMPYVIQGIPVYGHEVCDFWGDGCKTSENGFCSYAERRTDDERRSD